jgi:hypothetical protein
LADLVDEVERSLIAESMDKSVAILLRRLAPSG